MHVACTGCSPRLLLIPLERSLQLLQIEDAPSTSRSSLVESGSAEDGAASEGSAEGVEDDDE